MRENGTDRDVALLILSDVTDIKNAMSSIIDNLYGPVITEQPADVSEAAVGSTATFSVVASNVFSYQWQYKITNAANPQWANSSQVGYNTNSITVNVTEARYAYLYRCMITGLNGAAIYTNEVKMIAPVTPDESES